MIAAVLYATQLNVIQPTPPPNLALFAIAAVVLSGTSISGGKGSVFGTILGMVLGQSLENRLALTGVTNDATIIVTDSTPILAILITNLIQRLQKVYVKRAFIS